MADQLTINAGTQLPEFEEKRTREVTKPGDTTSTEATTETPERIEAGRKLEEAGEGERAAATEGVEQANLRAPIQRESAAEQARIATELAQAKERAITESADMIAQARTRTQARTRELEAMDSPSLYGNTDTHGKVVRGVALALGGLGDAIQKAALVRVGKSPPTIDTVGEIIDGILNQQKEHISKLKDSVVLARTGETDAREARTQMLADVDLRGAAMLNRAKSLMEARLAAMGKTPEQIAADENLAAMNGKIADKLAAHTAPLLDKVTKKIEGATVKTGGETVNRVPGKAQGAAPTGSTGAQSAALAKYVDEHPQASQGELVKYASETLGIPDAMGEVTRVAGVNSLPEKEGERKTVDLEGKPVLAPSARNVTAIAEQVAKTKRATGALDKLIDKIKEGEKDTVIPGLAVGNAVASHVSGTNLSSQTEEAISHISNAMDMPPSDAKIRMDHAIAGTGGIGLLKKGNAIENLTRLRNEIQEYGENKVNGLKTPVRDNVSRSTQPPPESPREAAKPAAAAPKAETLKDAAIRAIRARPNAPGSKLLRTKFHITDAEVAQ